MEIESSLVMAYQWSLYDIDQTDLESLLGFYFFQSKRGPESKQAGKFCDEVDWL